MTIDTTGYTTGPAAWQSATNPDGDVLTRHVTDQEIGEQFPDQVSRLAQAQERYEASKARLYREDGKQIYSAAEHETRHAALVATLDKELGAVERYLQSVIERADKEVTLLAADPADSLSKAELEEANLKATFVREDAEALKWPALRDRLKAVVEGGSKAQAFLWGRAAGRRFEALVNDARAGRRPMLLPPEERALGDVPALIDRLNARVRGTGGAEKRLAALRRRTVAQIALVRADQVRASADGRQAQWEANLRARIRGAMG